MKAKFVVIRFLTNALMICNPYRGASLKSLSRFDS